MQRTLRAPRFACALVPLIAQSLGHKVTHLKTHIIAFTFMLAALSCSSSPSSTAARQMTTSDESSAVDTYRDAINKASPADPVVDPKDPSIKPRLTFPTQLDRPQPPYPPALRRDRVQGRALLAGVIEKDGSVSNVTVLTSTGNPDLDQVCLDTLRNWRYKPALLGGQPCRLVVTTVFTFALP